MIKLNDYQISFKPEIVKDGRQYFPWLIEGPDIIGRERTLREALLRVVVDSVYIATFGLPF